MPQILLIDDDETQLRLREAILREAGLSVHTAQTSDQALVALRNREVAQSIRMIVTDHVMPGTSGAAFVRELRKLSPQVPILVISGLAEAEDEYKALGVSFLNKPCRPEELICRVRTEMNES
jgi:DNA-binding response OmpR family regulator